MTSEFRTPSQPLRGRVEEWQRNISSSPASCACEELGLPIEECICSEVGVGASPPPSSFTDTQGSLQEVSTYGAESSSVAPAEHRSSVFDTEFSEFMNDPDRDYESSLCEDPSLHPNSNNALNENSISYLDSETDEETVVGQRTNCSQNENSTPHPDPEADRETVAGQCTNCSLFSGTSNSKCSQVTGYLARPPEEALEPSLGTPAPPPGKSTPQLILPPSRAHLRRDSPPRKVKERETSESATEEGYQEPGPKHMTEWGISGGERPNKQRKLT